MTKARAIAVGILFAIGCAPDFEPASRIHSVRVLGSRADKPYAKPGDVVALELLAVDQRAEKNRPMTVFWVPSPCVNPRDDAYYNCYATFGSMFPRDVDLSAALTSGPTHSIRVPDDILGRSAASGTRTPFGTLVAFSMACAGRVRYVGTGSSPQSPPFACFDENGNRLGPDDFVFAFTRVFVFADRTNQNPVIDGLTLNGQRIDPNAGMTIDHCPNPSSDGDRDFNCPPVAVDVDVTLASQEPDPSSADAKASRESLWVNYYITAGRLRNDLRLLFDPQVGRVPNSRDELEAPAAIGEQVLWAVVHDNRGGVAWIRMPVHVR